MISVIIPLYNKKNTIKRTIESVLNQTYTDWELIIIDDGSTDGSVNEIAPYLPNNQIQYIQKVNKGVSSARNMGVNIAKGEWIIFIDADDYFLPNALYTLLELALRKKTKISTANFFVEENNIRKKVCIGKTECLIGNNYKSWFFMHCFPRAGAALFYNDILKKHPFDENLNRYEDAKFLFDIFRENIIAYSPKYVMIYSLDNTCLSNASNNLSKDFTFSMNFHQKSFWEKIVLADILNQGFKMYKGKSLLLYHIYAKYIYIAIIAKLLNIVRRIIIKIKK